MIARSLFILLTIVAAPADTLSSQLAEDEALRLFDDFADVTEMLSILDDSRRQEPVVDDGKPTKALLRKIRKSPYGGGYDYPARILISRDSSVVPSLLDAFAESDDYYRGCLIEILSHFPCAERNDAFLDELQELLAKPELHFLDDGQIHQLMMLLAADGDERVVPILNETIQDANRDETIRKSARTALRRMGLRGPEPGAASKWEVEGGIDTADLQLGLALVEALIGFECIKAPLQITEVDKAEKFTTLSGKAEDGTFTAKFSSAEAARIPVYYQWWGGPLNGIGQIGVLERKDGAWHVVYWRGLWLS